MVAGLSSWTAGCVVGVAPQSAQGRATSPAASPPAANSPAVAPAPTPVPVTPSALEPLTFSRLVVRIPGDSEIRVSGEEYRVRILEELRKANYPAVGAESLVFEQDKSADARFVLGGTLNEVDCRPASETHRRCRLGVQWELFDKAGERVVYRVVTRSATTGSDSGRMADELVWGAFHSLLAHARFGEALKKKTDSAAATSRPAPMMFKRCSDEARPMPKSSEAVLQATVVVESGAKMGSGTVVSPDGLVLTAAHVLAQSEATHVRKRTGEKLSAVVIRIDEHADVALLRVQSGAPHMCLSLRVEPIAVGEEVYAIGSPLSRELSFTLTRGIVSGYRELDGVQLVQTDASVNRGNSGGPIVDAQGRTAAVVSWKAFGTGVEGIAFGVPSSSALAELGLNPGDAADPALLSMSAAPPPAQPPAVEDTADALPVIDQQPGEDAGPPASGVTYINPKTLSLLGGLGLICGGGLLVWGATADDDGGDRLVAGGALAIGGAMAIHMSRRATAKGAGASKQAIRPVQPAMQVSGGIGPRSVALRLDF